LSEQFDFDTPVSRELVGSLKFDARKAYFGTEDVMPMWVADMDIAAPAAVTAALTERAQHPIYGYQMYPASMYQAMQAWFAKRFDWQIDRSSIVMCPGVVPTLTAIIEALTEPNEHVIIQPPVYHPFFSVVEETDRELVQNPLVIENGQYKMDLVHLESCFQQGAKLLIFCSPHNPVGRVWTKQELIDLLALAKRYQVTIVADEIHADLIYPEFTHTPFASIADGVSVISTVSASKTFNVPGLGLSAVIVENREQRKAINAVFKRWHINASNPFSIVAFEAAYRGGEAWLDALMAYLNNTKQKVAEFAELNWPNVNVMPSQGTYLLWLDCREMQLSDDELKQFFIEKAKVGMNAGFTFGAAGSGFMRLNIAAPQDYVMTACQRIADALQTFNAN
jgi:cystathionine beta-lyase